MSDYTLEAIRKMIGYPDQYMKMYSMDMVDQVINELFPPEAHEDVRRALQNLRPGLGFERLLLAVLLMSNGTIKDLNTTIELANIDYRDVLMPFDPHFNKPD